MTLQHGFVHAITVKSSWGRHPSGNHIHINAFIPEKCAAPSQKHSVTYRGISASSLSWFSFGPLRMSVCMCLIHCEHKAWISWIHLPVLHLFICGNTESQGNDVHCLTCLPYWLQRIVLKWTAMPDFCKHWSPELTWWLISTLASSTPGMYESSKHPAGANRCCIRFAWVIS